MRFIKLQVKNTEWILQRAPYANIARAKTVLSLLISFVITMYMLTVILTEYALQEQKPSEQAEINAISGWREKIIREMNNEYMCLRLGRCAE